MVPVAEDIQEGHEVTISRLWNTLEVRHSEEVSRIVAGEFGVSINIEGVDVMLLVVNPFVPKYLKESSTDKEGHNSAEPLGLEGISMEQLVSSSKAHALHLESIEEVEWGEGQNLGRGEHRPKLAEVLDIRKIGIESSAVNCEGGQGHEGHVGNKAFDSKPVGSLHQLEDDTIGQDSISVLAFRWLNVFVSPVFIDCRDVLFNWDFRCLAHGWSFCCSFTEHTSFFL